MTPDFAGIKPLPEVLYAYCPPEAALIISELGVLRWSSPVLFNDPFDNQFPFLLKGNYKKVAQLTADRLRKNVLGDKDACPYENPDINNMVEGLKKDQNNFLKKFSEVEEALCSFYSDPYLLTKENNNELIEAFSMLSILCLSARVDSLLMWAHYTKNHTGAVFGFSPISKNSIFKMAAPVSYHEDIPAYPLEDFRFNPDSKEIMKHITLSKGIDWKYEEEWRLVTALHDPKVQREMRKFHRNDLVSVHLGCRMTKDNKAAITSLMSRNFPHAKLYQARKSDRNFSLIFEEINKGKTTV